MKTKLAGVVWIAAGIVLLLVLLGVTRVMSAKAAQEDAYRSVFHWRSADEVNRHFLIYLDVNSCLACTEDMSAWIELEEELPGCGCSFSIYAPASDSFDVAYAMQLEGLNSPVQVLSEADLVELRWTDVRTPIKVLLDSLARPINIRGAMGNREESRRYAEQILSDVCTDN
jgi:hypothetical protein